MARKPLRLVQANLGGANGWDQARCRKIMLRTIELTKPDVLFLCEAFPITMDELGLDTRVWAVLHDPTDGARAGSALVCRRSRVAVGSHRLRRYSVAGSGVRARYSWEARLQVDGSYYLEAVAGHPPPKRGWLTIAPLWWTNARLAAAQVYGCDFNRLSGFVATALNRKTRMVGIVGFALAKALPASPAKHFDVGSDHPAVLTVLYPAV